MMRKENISASGFPTHILLPLSGNVMKLAAG